MHKERVSEIEFWKNRIENAHTKHHSVYLCNPILWDDIFHAHRKIIRRVIPKDAYVLDAGCGYGRMCELFDSKNYEGVDFSPDFIKMAMKEYPNHSFEVQNLKKLPYEKHQFEWAFCVSIKDMIVKYDSLKSWLEIEKELKRVAKKILILEYTNYTNYEII
jgi:ubiquinone/menaquinone biosynthesis C-methylase UbiE